VKESLPELLGGCRAGDEAAIAELVRRFQTWGIDLARALVDDAGLAEDVVQEAFVTALQQLDRLREPMAFPGWFRQIVRTHANRVTRKRREVAVADMEGAVREECSAPDALAQEELRECVRDAVRNLPAAGRATAELFYLDERSCGEVADLLGVPTGTVKRRLHDARKRLRDMLLGYVRGEPEEREEAEAVEAPKTRLPL